MRSVATSSLRMIVTTALLLALSGCRFIGGEDGIFRDRQNEYMEAEVLPRMTVPENLDSYTLDDLYVIPELLADNDEAFEEIPLPKPIESSRREGVVIQALGDRRWIVIDATPAQVWPLIRDYWTQLQVVMEYENPSARIMETAWLEVNDDQETRNKYRVSIEPGLHSGSSEIYVKHLSNLRTQPIPQLITWPEISTDPDRERQILDSVSQFLADRNDIYQASTASLLAGSIESARKANIVEDASGKEILELRVDYDRAWVQVRQALDNAQIEVLDSDRDQSYINVRFAGLDVEEDEPGFIGRLFSNNDEELQELQEFSIRLQQVESAINVIAEFLGPELDDAELASELLQAINDNLS